MLNFTKNQPPAAYSHLRCRLHRSSAGRLFVVQIEPHTVLCGGLVALRPVEVDEHVEGKFLSVDGADGA